MRLFLETDDPADIRWAMGAGLIDGVIIGASLLARDVADEDVRAELGTICRLVPGPVLVELVSVQADEMYREGRELAKIADTVVVTIPMIEEGLTATHRLSREGIRVNSSLIFTAAQALLAAKAGASFVSPAATAVDEIGNDGVALVRGIRDILDNYVLECELLVSSIRDPFQFTEAARLRADAAGVSPPLLHSLLVHPLTDRALDQSLNAWSKRIAQSRSGV
jgi:transaldolase